MRNLLLLASGGSGDALSAHIYASEHAKNFDRFLIATVIWERALFDPTGGPRPNDAIINLSYINNIRVINSKTEVLTGYTPVSQLAKEIGTPIVYLELSFGVMGLIAQIQDIIANENVVEIWLMDTGGDLLSTGIEPGLLSPTLDSCFLSAIKDLNVPNKCIIVGATLDGELSEKELVRNAKNAGFSESEWISEERAKDYLVKFDWWPTEAPLLTLHACSGKQGELLLHPNRNSVILGGISTTAFVGQANSLTAYSNLYLELEEPRSQEEIRAIVYAHTQIDEFAVKKKDRVDQEAIIEICDLEIIRFELEARGIQFMSLRAACKIVGVKNSIQRSFLISCLEKSDDLWFSNPLIALRRDW